MIKFKGKGVYSAVGFGRLSLYKRHTMKLSPKEAEDPEVELERLSAAADLAFSQLHDLYETALTKVCAEDAAIFEIHIMLLKDNDYWDEVTRIVTKEHKTAEYAVSCAGKTFAQLFRDMEDSYMRARSADIIDISNRLVCNLTGSEIDDPESGERIVCADDLVPSETIHFDKSKIIAFITAGGSQFSHTAILARSMGIPAVIGVGMDFLSQINDDMEAIVDGETGEIFLDPDEDTKRRLMNKRREQESQKRRLAALKGFDNVTLDGRRINIYANIGSSAEIVAVKKNDAGGVGLFRSEFLFLENGGYPSEEDQFLEYKKALSQMEGKLVVIRTMDIGADKQAECFGLDKEENPALGMRAIRLCLTRPEIFRTQLRALYRASVYGRLGIMFPMISSVDELEEILKICEEIRQEFREKRIPFAESVMHGIMIETPAAAVISDLLAPMVDFFSVGTNDLIQYTLACDRQNPHLSRFCDSHHDAVIRLIEFAAKSAHSHGAWIGVCGELAADTSMTETFLRMGIDELSVSPEMVLKIRQTVRKTNLSY